jgi:tetratricopeptide (TPR) repeat protein
LIISIIFEPKALLALILVAVPLLANWNYSMSRNSRARPAAMSTSGSPPSPGPHTLLARWGTFLAGVLVVLAALAAYYNSFTGPFIFDDQYAITDNPTIKQLGSSLSPPPEGTMVGRPLLNLTFALNYALSGMDAWSYHAANLLIHALAGLTLFGLVRRSLCERSTFNVQHPTSKSNNPIIPELSSADASMLALAVTILWVVHPLQTEAVTYVSQRAESLMGLFYLLTLYCFVRGMDCRSGFTPDIRLRPVRQAQGYGGQASGMNPDLHGLQPSPSRRSFSEGGWLTASILACFLGALTKQTIVTAPVMVLLYDRTFVAGSFRESLQQRWRYYLGLAGMWVLLFARLRSGLQGQSVGFGLGVTWWDYALTSCRSILLYLKLAVWPHPLVLDYGAHVIHQAAEGLPYVLVLAALVTAVAIALWRWPAVGFVGAWFFVILAPTSSIIPVAGQPTAEHRVYLSLAAVILLVVLGLYSLIGRRSLILFAALAVGLGLLSVRRNEDYRSALSICQDTIAKCPENARVYCGLGEALADLGQAEDSIAAYENALRIDPDFADAHANLGVIFMDLPGRLPDAIDQFRLAIRSKPDHVKAHFYLGIAWSNTPGRLADGIAEFREALSLKPGSADINYALGSSLLKMPGQLPDAIAHFEAALRIKPDMAEAHYGLGMALLDVPGRLPDAIAELETTLRLNPDFAVAHYNLATALMQTPGRLPEAISEFEAAVRINPAYAKAHASLGVALAKAGRWPEAAAQFEAAIKIDPDTPGARENLAAAQQAMSR